MSDASRSDRRSLWGVLRWPVALGVLAALFYFNRESVAQIASRPVDGSAVAPAILFVVGGFLVTFYRWYLLMRAQALSCSLAGAVRLGLLGYLFNYVAPGQAGGDLVKAVLLAKDEPEKRTLAVSTIVMDRLLGMVGLFWVAAGFAFLVQTELTARPEFRAIALPLLLGACAGVVGVLLMLWPKLTELKPVLATERLPKVGPLFTSVIESLRNYQSSRGTILAGLGLSIAGHLMMLSGFYWCGRVVLRADELPSWLSHMQFIPPAELAGVLVPIPGGVGGLEGAASWFFGLCGYPEGHGFAEIIAYRVVSILIASAGAGYYFAMRSEIKAAAEVAARVEGGE